MSRCDQRKMAAAALARPGVQVIEMRIKLGYG